MSQARGRSGSPARSEAASDRSAALSALIEDEEYEPAATRHACNVVVLLGPPASGKSTVGRALAERYGCTHFDVGQHIRENIPLGADLEDFVMQAVEQVLRTQRNVVLNGFPKYPLGLHMLTKGFHWVTIDCVLWLQITDVDTIAKRATARHLSGERPEDDEDNFRDRLQNFDTNTLLVLKILQTSHTVFRLDASRPKEEVEAAAIKACSRALGIGIPSGSSARGSSARRDPDEAEFEVVVCLMSGEERMRPLLPRRATVRTLRAVLIDDGEKDVDLRFMFRGQEIADPQVLINLDAFTVGSTIHMVREKKKPAPRPVYTRRDSPPICFTGDSLASVLGADGAEVHTPFSKVRVGDLVRTDKGHGKDLHRRVQRVWAHRLARMTRTFELAPGCRITPGHPFLWNGKWIKPEDMHRGEETFEEFVYQLEVEGHVDTALVGGVVCALLGRYCGPDFGWNVFTRKTVKCSRQPCSTCAKAVVPGLDFSYSKLPEHMLPPARSEPY